MTLLSLLKGRYDQAEKHTKKKFHEDVERAISDYEAHELNLAEVVQSSGLDAINKRYEFVIPLIFTNTESMKASLWDRLPDLVFKGRGSQDDGKKQKIIAAHEYLKDKLDLETFAILASHWFILLGFASAHGSFKNETYEAPMYDENGEPMMDEMGQPLMQTLYSYNDPVIELGDPLKEYYSPESEFSIDGKSVPFQFRKKLMSVEEIKRIYGVEVEADAELDIDGYKKNDELGHSDIKRANIYYYYGSVSEEAAKDVDEESKQPLIPDWESGAEYYIIYTAKKFLYIEKRGERLCKLAKWYGNPNSFFGFGLGKIGRQFQKERSIRRGQQIRLADVAAFPKIAIKNDGANSVDTKAMLDPRAQVVVLYESEAPTYLQPGNLADVVMASEQAADRDAQQAFGLIDITGGSQTSSTVNTATGQTIFADAAEKRVRLAKKNFMKFYEQVVIMLLKLAQANWDETKLVTITDDDGQEVDVELTKEDFKDIDFDNDIEIDAESATVNKDIEREQSIALYDKTKDDPIIDRRVLFTDMLRDGFKKKNPERYIKKTDLQPGMMLTDEMGNQYTVDESGEVVPSQNMEELAQPSGEDVAQSQAGLMGSI